ncbi:MAG: hypothetical protein Q7K43_05040, partial [Candidatus Woesearchaeota archaeon]|nr:hypothetical protein [Candidatus Woesearchaeota archaeon]
LSIEKRVRKQTNFAPRTPITILEEKSVKTIVAEHILKTILKGPWTITRTTKTTSATVLAWTADDEAEARMNVAIQGVAQPQTVALPLSNLKNEEVVLYAHLKNIHGTMPEPTQLQKLMHTLEQKTPGAIVNLAKNLRDK